MILENALGLDHPEVAYSQLASLNQDQGKYPPALELYQQGMSKQLALSGSHGSLIAPAALNLGTLIICSANLPRRGCGSSA